MKCCDFTVKGTPLREYTLFELFCVTVRWGSDPKSRDQKVRKSRAAPTGMKCRR